MKICPKCGCGNADGALYCRECSASLARVRVESSDEILNEQMAACARRERRRAVALFSVVLGETAVLFVLWFLSIRNGTYFSGETFLLLLRVAFAWFLVFYDALISRFRLGIWLKEQGWLTETSYERKMGAAILGIVLLTMGIFWLFVLLLYGEATLFELYFRLMPHRHHYF